MGKNSQGSLGKKLKSKKKTRRERERERERERQCWLIGSRSNGVPHSFWNIGGWDRKLRNRRFEQLKQVHPSDMTGKLSKG
ncbi:conserved hypothetical protein [Ricinus communis]|uniref:Uncharacterized protein n=1 Tax=Ricinus communis TaxID=3988 RepID=B9T697_RICCO|nr:conserved hypothetical protein [Ricinus communis]